MADVNAQLPGPGKEIAVVFKFNIAWVREAMAAVDITVENLNDQGKCKAALITYYQGLNTAESKVEATKALCDSSTRRSGRSTRPRRRSQTRYGRRRP